MKISLCLAMMCAAHVAFSQLEVSEPVVVAAQAEWGNMRPRVALNGDNQPVVIWTNNATSSVYCSLGNGEAFTPPVKLNPDGLDISAFDWSGPEIASNGNSIFVVFKQVPETSLPIYCVHSNDGGWTWSDTVRVDSSLPLMSRMPSVGVTGDGNPVVAFMREDTQIIQSEWMACVSSDGGNSFGDPVSVSQFSGEEVCDCCPSSVLINGNNIAVLYRNNDNNLRDIRAGISTDGGATFTLSADMDDLDWIIGACPSSGPQGYYAGNEIRSAWMSSASGDARVFYSSFDQENMLFSGSFPVEQVASNQTQNYPTLAGDDNDIAIALEQFQSGQRDIYFSWSNGNFEENNYSNLTASMEGNQMRPHMVFDGLRWHLVFTDNGGDAVQYLSIQWSGGNGVDENNVPGFSIYPNPSQGRLTLTRHGEQLHVSTYQIIDASGKVVMEKTAGGASGDRSTELDGSSLVPGFYFVKTTDGSAPVKWIRMD